MQTGSSSVTGEQAAWSGQPRRLVGFLNCPFTWRILFSFRPLAREEPRVAATKMQPGKRKPAKTGGVPLFLVDKQGRSAVSGVEMSGMATTAWLGFLVPEAFDGGPPNVPTIRPGSNGPSVGRLPESGPTRPARQLMQLLLFSHHGSIPLKMLPSMHAAAPHARCSPSLVVFSTTS